MYSFLVDGTIHNLRHRWRDAATASKSYYGRLGKAQSATPAYQVL